MVSNTSPLNPPPPGSGAGRRLLQFVALGLSVPIWALLAALTTP